MTVRSGVTFIFQESNPTSPNSFIVKFLYQSETILYVVISEAVVNRSTDLHQLTLPEPLLERIRAL